MSNTINADDGIISGIAGLKYSADTSGALVLQTNGTTAITISASQAVSFTGAVTFTTADFTNLSYTGTFTGGTGVVNLGTGQFYKDASGNVGIGTASPAYKLHVSSSAAPSIVIEDTDTPTQAYIGVTNSSARFGTLTNTPVSIYVNNAQTALFDASGSLGIGVTPNTWSPGKAIEIGYLGNSVYAPGSNDIVVSSGAYYNAGWKYGIANSLGASNYEQYNGQHRFYVVAPAAHAAGDAITFTQAMTLNASGNLGIGTASPQDILHIESSTGSNVLRITASTTGTNTIQLGDTASSGAGYVQYANNGDYMRFATAATERMRIDSSGNVGIGTSSPSARLAVTSGVSLVADFNSTINAPYIRFSNSGTAKFFIGDGTAVGGASGYYDFYATAGIGQRFFTNDAERFRIASNGAFGLSGANYGTSGQVLVSQGSGSAPVWGSAVSAGQIIQVIQATNNTIYQVSGSGTFTGLSITITPRNSSSRFLLIMNIGQLGQSGGGSTVALNFYRDATNLNYVSGGTYNGMVAFVNADTNAGLTTGPTVTYIDSPATASAITYTCRYSCDGTKWVGRRGNDTFIAASQQFQVLEIAG